MIYYFNYNDEIIKVESKSMSEASFKIGNARMSDKYKEGCKIQFKEVLSHYEIMEKIYA